LADALGGEEAGMVEDGEMGGDGGLRKGAARFDLAGADAEFVGVILAGEVLFRVLHFGEDTAADGVGEGFEDLVEVWGGGGLYRHMAIYGSVFGDMKGV